MIYLAVNYQSNIRTVRTDRTWLVLYLCYIYILVGSAGQAMKHGPESTRLIKRTKVPVQSRLYNSEIDSLSSPIVVWSVFRTWAESPPHAYAMIQATEYKSVRDHSSINPNPPTGRHHTSCDADSALEKLHITYGLTSLHFTPSCSSKPRSHFHDRDSWG